MSDETQFPRQEQQPQGHPLEPTQNVQSEQPTQAQVTEEVDRRPEDDPDRVRDAELIYFREENLPGGATSPTKRVSLARISCGVTTPAPPTPDESAADDAQGEG